MTSSFRRYEILLPLRFNDGSAVPDEFMGKVVLELRKQFGAVSSETNVIRGVWEYQDEVYRDDLVRVFLDVPDNEANRQFFTDYKTHLKERFGQIDIWMTTYPVEVI
ncbi:MAG TPA: hypothetical protein VNX28_05445 [Gemmataceae bacterium]|jgi:hypothetical protein|nr:hypothetical protein [Gemmataceae bacterium]